MEQQAQFQCSVEWLAGRASASGDSGLHQTTLGPLYHPFTSCGKLKQKVVDLLSSPVVYCAVYNSLFTPEEQLSSTSFWPLIQHLARQGVYLMVDDDTALNHTMLASKAPFEQSAHVALIDGLMRGYVSSLHIRKRVVKVARSLAYWSASKELPTNDEEALLLWLNKTTEAVCKKYHLYVEQMHSEVNPEKRRQNKMKLLSHPGPLAVPKSSDLAMAVSHGQCLPAVVLHYFPSSYSYSDFYFRADLLTEEEAMHNLSRVRLTGTSFLPPPALHISPELLVFWAPSGVLTNNITAMIALLFNCLEPVDKTSLKSSLNASFFSLANTSGRKQLAASTKEDKSKRLSKPSTGHLVLPQLSQQSLAAQGLYSSSMLELSSNQSLGSSFYQTPQAGEATAFEKRRTGHLTSFSTSMISDPGFSASRSHSLRQAPGMVFVAPVKSTQGALVRSSINSSLMRQQRHPKLISASIENLAISEHPLVSSEQPIPAMRNIAESSSNSLLPTYDTREHRPARPKSRELPRIKFFREPRHTDKATVEPLSSSSLVEANDAASMTSTEHKTAVEFFVDLDQVPSQDADREQVLRSSYTLEKSAVSQISEKSDPPSVEVKTKVEQHQSSSVSDDAQLILSIFGSETDEEEEAVTSPCLDPYILLLKMKLRTQQRSIVQQAREKEEERISRRSEILMKVFFRFSKGMDLERQPAGEEPAQESYLLNPAQPVPTVTSPEAAATAMKGHKLLFDESQTESKPGASETVVSSRPSTARDASVTSSSSSVVVESTRIIFPASARTQPEPPKSIVADTEKTLVDKHELTTLKKQEIIKARLEKRDRHRRESAAARRREERAHRRLMSAAPAGSLGSDESVRSGLFRNQQGAAVASNDSLTSGSAYSLATQSSNGHTGPECYIKPPVKTNKKLVRNALCFVCLAGEANISTKQKALAVLDTSNASHFMILFRNALGCKFKAFYGYQPEDDKITRIFGTGPKTIHLDMVTRFFKYNSGAKEFRPVHSRLFSIFIDALAIQDHYWDRKKK